MKARPCQGVGSGGDLSRGSHVWNYPEESGLTRCSAAASWWHEGKQAPLFPFSSDGESTPFTETVPLTQLTERSRWLFWLQSGSLDLFNVVSCIVLYPNDVQLK